MSEESVPRLGRVDAAYAEELAREDKMVQWAIHPAVLPALVEWLDGRGTDFVLVQNATDEDLPWAIVSPRML